MECFGSNDSGDPPVKRAEGTWPRGTNQLGATMSTIITDDDMIIDGVSATIPMSHKPTDIIPHPAEVLGRMLALPSWAMKKAEAIVNPPCPGLGVLYPIPTARKQYLVLTVAEGLVLASIGQK